MWKASADLSWRYFVCELVRWASRSGCVYQLPAPGLSLVYTARCVVHIVAAGCVTGWCGCLSGSLKLEINLCLVTIEYQITKFGFQVL